MKKFPVLIDYEDNELLAATDNQTFIDHLENSEPALCAFVVLDDEDAELMLLRKAADDKGFYKIPWSKYADQLGFCTSQPIEDIEQ